MIRERVPRLDKAWWRAVLVACCTVAALVTMTLPVTAAVVPAEGESVTFYHHDALGSPLAATDEQGRLLWHEGYEPYGRSLGRYTAEKRPLGDVSRTEEAGRDEMDVGYTGHVRDGGSQLAYMQQRHMDPALGRFLSNDPVGFQSPMPGSFPRYAYAQNDPYSFVDPDGRQAADVLGGFEFGYSRTPPMRRQTIDFPKINPGLVDPNLVGGVVVLGLLAVLASAADDEGENKEEKKRPRRPSVEVQGEADANATDEEGDLVCEYCGQPLTTESGQPDSREFDHEVPYSEGGDSSSENINSTCRTCNRSKGSKPLDEWMSSQ